MSGRRIGSLVSSYSYRKNFLPGYCPIRILSHTVLPREIHDSPSVRFLGHRRRQKGGEKEAIGMGIIAS
jgi:hypothetical protein